MCVGSDQIHISNIWCADKISRGNIWKRTTIEE
jgi:hypothetical protein